MRRSMYGPNAPASNSRALPTRSRLLRAIGPSLEERALAVGLDGSQSADLQPGRSERVIRPGLLRPLLRLGDQEQPVREVAGRVAETADFREQLCSGGLAVIEQAPDEMLRDLPDGQTV